MQHSHRLHSITEYDIALEAKEIGISSFKFSWSERSWAETVTYCITMEVSASQDYVEDRYVPNF